MFSPWREMILLAVEFNEVIGLRLMRCAAGGNDALAEADLMLSEKIDAAFEAGATLLAGGSVEHVVDRYPEHVSANSSRLQPA